MKKRQNCFIVKKKVRVRNPKEPKRFLGGKLEETD